MIELFKIPDSSGHFFAQTENAEVAGVLSRNGRIEATSTRVSKRKRRPITTWIIKTSETDVLRITGELGEVVRQQNGVTL